MDGNSCLERRDHFNMGAAAAFPSFQEKDSVATEHGLEADLEVILLRTVSAHVLAEHMGVKGDDSLGYQDR
jgi:hypothetical protein